MTISVGALIALLAGGLALGVCGLLPAGVCLLTLVLIGWVGMVLPRWFPRLVDDSPQRTGLALLALLMLVAATAASGPDALLSGSGDSGLEIAVGELQLPTHLPIGLLAALAAGALVAVALELGERRGVQSALVLGIAVTGLASVAGPGRDLLPVLVLGWPAVLLTLTRLAGAPGIPASGAAGYEMTLSSRIEPVTAGPAGHAVRPARATAPREGRNQFHWHVLPVLASIALGCALLTIVVLTGAAGSTVLPTEWGRHGGGSASSGRSPSGYLGGELNLNARGALGSQPVVEVPDDSPTLWRAGTLDDYTGAGWFATTSAAGLPKLATGPAGEVSVTALPGEQSQQAEVDRTDRVRPVHLDAAQVLAPGRLLTVSAPGLITGSVFSVAGNATALVGQNTKLSEYQVRTQVLPKVGDPASSAELLAAGRLPLLQGIATTAPSFTDTSNISALSHTSDLSHTPALSGAATLPGGTALSGEGADPRWTELPGTVTERTRRLGLQLVDGAASQLAAVEAVQRELDRRMTYSLDSPVPSKGADAVDDALFVSHSGFCEQFASAEVVLLRAAGVPARMAVGFSGGAPGGDGFRTLRHADAHAWVEVWFPGVGWASSDPTPTAEPTGRWQSVGDAVRSFIGAPGTWMAALLVFAFLGLMASRRWRSVPPPSPIGSDPYLDRDLAIAFARLDAVLTGQGRGRAPNETLRALDDRLGTSMSAADGISALGVLERALYAPLPPSRAECLSAAEAIDRALLEAQSPVAPSMASRSRSA